MGTDGMSKRKDIHTVLSLGLKTEGASEQVRGNARQQASVHGMTQPCRRAALLR